MARQEITDCARVKPASCTSLRRAPPRARPTRAQRSTTGTSACAISAILTTHWVGSSRRVKHDALKEFGPILIADDPHGNNAHSYANAVRALPREVLLLHKLYRYRVRRRASHVAAIIRDGTCSTEYFSYFSFLTSFCNNGNSFLLVLHNFYIQFYYLFRFGQ